MCSLASGEARAKITSRSPETARSITCSLRWSERSAWQRAIASATSGRGGSSIVMSPTKNGFLLGRVARRRLARGRQRPAREREHALALARIVRNASGDLLARIARARPRCRRGREPWCRPAARTGALVVCSRSEPSSASSVLISLRWASKVYSWRRDRSRRSASTSPRSAARPAAPRSRSGHHSARARCLGARCCRQPRSRAARSTAAGAVRPAASLRRRA